MIHQTVQPTPASASTLSVSFVGLIRSEFLKVTSQRGQRIGFAVAAILMVAFAVLAALVTRNDIAAGHTAPDDPETQGLALVGYLFAVLAVGAMSAMSVAVEWSSGAIIGSIASTQRRGGIIGSKTIAAGVCWAGLLTGSAVACVLITRFVSGADPSVVGLFSAGSARQVGGAVVSSALVAVLAVGLGFLLRTPAAAISAFAALVLVLPQVLNFVPGRAGQILTRMQVTNALYAVTSPSGEHALAGYGVLVAWAAAARILGWWRFTNTDS